VTCGGAGNRRILNFVRDIRAFGLHYNTSLQQGGSNSGPVLPLPSNRYRRLESVRLPARERVERGAGLTAAMSGWDQNPEQPCEHSGPTEPACGQRGNTHQPRADSENMSEAKVHGGQRCSRSTQRSHDQNARRIMADSTPRATADASDGSTSVISHADWAGCRTIADLAELNARFCESRAPETRSPGHFGPLNSESDLIREDLIRLNRRGWLTTNSQPTIETDTPVHQRSYLCAFIPKEDLERLMPGVVGRSPPRKALAPAPTIGSGVRSPASGLSC